MNKAVIALYLLSLTCQSFAQQQRFSDDFNRPDSSDVGNGWFNTSGNSGGNLAIKNGAVTCTAFAGGEGIYRPWPFTGPATVSAAVTDMNGFYSLLRFDNFFTILNDGTLFGGYGIEIARGDQNYSDSRVNLTDHGTVIATAYSTFQYGPQINVSVTFTPDGSVLGSISDASDVFNFSFGPRTIQSTGNNFSWGTTGPDDRDSSYTFSTLDNVTLTVTPSCALSYHGFHQSDSPALGVPTYFGYNSAEQSTDPPRCFDPLTGKAKTGCYGCALCSLATMLTSFPGLDSMTPAQLDAALTIPGVKGYSDYDDVNWCAIANATGQPVGLVDSRGITDLNTLNAYLQEHFCTTGDRVILHLTTYQSGVPTPYGHYVLVTGTSGTDWLLFDPGWTSASPTANLGTLQGHLAGFTTISPTSGQPISWRFTIAGVRTYRFGSACSANLCGTAHSPIELLASDPLGRRIGYDMTTGDDVFEIPGSSYVRDYQISDDDENIGGVGEPTGIKTLCVPSPLNGSYQVQLIGQAAGAYTFDLNAFWPGSGGKQIETISGTAAAGVTETNWFTVPLVISAFSLVSNIFNVSFSSQPGINYTLEGESTLNTSGWTVLQTLVATGAVTTISQSATGAMMFFRLKAQ